MSILKLVAIVMIMGVAIVCRGAYVKFISRSLEEYRGFILYLEHIEGRIGCYLEHGDSLYEGFSNEALSRCGFLGALRDGKSHKEAFGIAEHELAMDADGKRVLGDFFRSLGTGYLERELRALELTLERLRQAEKKQDEELIKRVKVASAVCICTALGIVLLII
ncbi:MAG: hypothetical protein IJX38_05360 [Clostridia bacterium]|nr:hypothetical protein [Clostridia bacterium]